MDSQQPTPGAPAPAPPPPATGIAEAHRRHVGSGLTLEVARLLESAQKLEKRAAGLLHRAAKFTAARAAHRSSAAHLKEKAEGLRQLVPSLSSEIETIRTPTPAPGGNAAPAEAEDARRRLQIRRIELKVAALKKKIEGLESRAARHLRIAAEKDAASTSLTEQGKVLQSEAAGVRQRAEELSRTRETP